METNGDKWMLKSGQRMPTTRDNDQPEPDMPTMPYNGISYSVRLDLSQPFCPAVWTTTSTQQIWQSEYCCDTSETSSNGEHGLLQHIMSSLAHRRTQGICSKSTRVFA